MPGAVAPFALPLHTTAILAQALIIRGNCGNKQQWTEQKELEESGKYGVRHLCTLSPLCLMMMMMNCVSLHCLSIRHNLLLGFVFD